MGCEGAGKDTDHIRQEKLLCNLLFPDKTGRESLPRVQTPSLVSVTVSEEIWGKGLWEGATDCTGLASW